MEVLTNQFNQKDKEIEIMIQRMAEASLQNEGL
jgi:hypothetical protein